MRGSTTPTSSKSQTPSSTNSKPSSAQSSNDLVAPSTPIPIVVPLTVAPSENVRVVVRCRPLSRKESERNCKLIVDVVSESNSISVTNPNPTESSDPTNNYATTTHKSGGDGSFVNPSIKSFTFDAVFSPDSTQADVYNEVARPIVENVLQGYNGTIFAYGQTGTGKTFTMEGVYNVPELKGIIPNSFAQIFSHIAKAEGDQRFLVRCSYLEIYNEDVRDLLAKQSSVKLEVKEHRDKGVYVKDLSSFVVRNADDMDRIMGIGNKNRSVASTNMNSVSSRSHAIFTITVECSMDHKVGGGDKEKDNKKGGGRSFRMGKLNLVDLAGSERLSKTQATGDRLKEATKINLSLSNLGNVISALVEGNSHIPYRNSKLTRLLQDSLGGNAKTVMVANVGPADYNYDETVSSLRFANRAKNIKNHAIINEDPKDALLRQFEKEIQELRKQLEEELANAEAAAGGGGHPGESMSDYNHDGEDDDYEDDDDDQERDRGGLGHLSLSVPDDEALLGIKGELQNHAALSSTIGSESKDHRTVMTALKDKVMTWKETEAQKLGLTQKLKSLQRKILVGGENLLDKSQEQEELLLRSMKEISLRKEEEAKLQSHLVKQEEERQSLESKILFCQEQNLGVSKKLKKVWYQYQAQKHELDQFRLEYQEETDALVDEVHKLSRELQYHNQIINNFIPPVYQTLIEKSVKWQPDSTEWTLKCVAYAGNNMTRGRETDAGDTTAGHHNRHHKNDVASVDLSSFYVDIEEDLPSNERSLEARGGTSTISRPMTSLNRPSTSMQRPKTGSSHNFGRDRDRPERSRMGF